MPRKDLEDHRRHRRFAAGSAHRDRCDCSDEMREQLGAMDDGDVERARRDEVRHLLLHRRRHRRARRNRGPMPLPSCGITLMPSRSSWARSSRALAAIESAVAAARRAARHHLELGERAHAGAAESRRSGSGPRRAGSGMVAIGPAATI